MPNFIILDLETTGLDANNDKIIECSAIKTDKMLSEIDRIDFVCNPWIKIPNVVLNLTWIWIEEIENAKSFEHYTAGLNNFIWDSDIIIGHNIKFDIGFLNNNWVQINNGSLDTHTLAWIFMPGHESYALEVLSDILDIDHEFKHRALWDVLACKDILKIVVWEIRNAPKTFIEEINKIWFRWEYLSFIKNSLWDEYKIFDGLNLHSKKINDNPYLQKINKKQVQQIDHLKTWEEIMKWDEHQKSFFEWNSKEKLIEKISSFFDSPNKSPSTVIVQNYAYKDILKIFWDSINIIEPPYLMTNKEKIKSYLNEVWFNKDNEAVLLKILFAQSNNKILSCTNLNIAHDDFKIWNKFFALKNDNIFIKEKNLVEFSIWQKNHEKFKDHNILFIDPNPESYDSECIFWESKVLDTIEDEKEKIEIEKVLMEIKNEILKENQMTEYWVFLEVSNEIKKSEKFEKLLNLLKDLKRLIWGEPLLEKQKNILRTFINKDNYYNFINVNSNLKLSIHSLKINLLENIEEYFKQASFWFFSWSIMWKLDYQKKFFEIEINDFEKEKFPEVKISCPDLNCPWWKNPEFTEYSFTKLSELIHENKDKRICIFSKSKKQTETIAHFLNDQFDDTKIFWSWISWWVNKLIHKANHTKTPFVLIWNPDFFNKYFMSWSEAFDLWIIMRLPFDNPNWVGKLRSQKYNNSFWEFALPRSVIQIKQFICASWVSEIFFMDNRVRSAQWAEVYVKFNSDSKT